MSNLWADTLRLNNRLFLLKTFTGWCRPLLQILARILYLTFQAHQKLSENPRRLWTLSRSRVGWED